MRQKTIYFSFKVYPVPNLTMISKGSITLS